MLFIVGCDDIRHDMLVASCRIANHFVVVYTKRDRKKKIKAKKIVTSSQSVRLPVGFVSRVATNEKKKSIPSWLTSANHKSQRCSLSTR